MIFCFRLGLDGEWALEKSQKLKIPGLILHGDKDILTDHDASKTFANKSSVCKFNSFKGGYHELHNDIEKELVFSSIVDWISNIINGWRLSDKARRAARRTSYD